MMNKIIKYENEINKLKEGIDKPRKLREKGLM